MLETNLNLPTVLFKKWDDWDLIVDLPDQGSQKVVISVYPYR